MGRPAVAAPNGLYVHDPDKTGTAYYAVTACVNDVENLRDVSPASALSKRVEETVGPGEPILCRLLMSKS